MTIADSAKHADVISVVVEIIAGLADVGLDAELTVADIAGHAGSIGACSRVQSEAAEATIADIVLNTVAAVADCA